MKKIRKTFILSQTGETVETVNRETAIRRLSKLNPTLVVTTSSVLTPDEYQRRTVNCWPR